MAESPPSRPPPDLETLQFNAWDAEFSADMSTKMRVPDSIRVAGDSKDAPSREAITTNGFDGFMSSLPSAPSTTMTTSAPSPLPEDSFGLWGRPVGPEHHDAAYGLMHPHDALEMNRDRTRRSMTVPQRILVAGDEETESFGTSLSRQHSVASSAPSRHQMELDLSSAARTHMGAGGDSGVQLSTPPEVLTIEAKFPTVYHEETPMTERPSRGTGGGGLPGGDPRSASPLLIKRKAGGGVTDIAQGYGSLQGSINDLNVSHLNITPLDDPTGAISTVQEETLLLRRHVAKLSRRVNQLEQDNLRRNYREYLVYPVMLGYFIVKLLSWFRRPN